MQEKNQMTIDSKYKFIDVKNSGWLNNQIGNYAAAVVNIDKSNYTREFIATAYAQIHYRMVQLKQYMEVKVQDIATHVQCLILQSR